jgi:hypothetical protein
MRFLNVFRTLFFTLPFSCAAADEINDEVTSILERRAAIGVLLSDDDAISFGIADFDPNKLLGTNIDEFGNTTTVSERRNKSVYILPYSHKFGDDSSAFDHQFKLRAYLIDSKSEFALNPESEKDDVFDERTRGIAIGYAFEYADWDNFSLTSGIDLHYILYDNQFTANSTDSELFAIVFDRILLNTSAETLIASPHISLHYQADTRWFNYRFSSTYKGFNGVSWGDADMGSPSGFYWTNEAYIAHEFSHSKQQIFSGIKRIEVSKSLQDSIGSDHYYELSLGWIVKQPTHLTWVKNVGVGINLNYGSELSGGSIRLFFNH